MTAPLIHGNRRTVSASAILKALGDDLGRIKQEDGLTWADLGRVLGKSEDQAAKYAEATADMPVTAFYFAKREWNGRFTGTADALVGHRVADGTDDRQRESHILQAALALSVALSDGELKDEEVAANRATLEMARDSIDGLLARLKVPAA